jgi:hypothetical protein
LDRLLKFKPGRILLPGFKDLDNAANFGDRDRLQRLQPERRWGYRPPGAGATRASQAGGDTEAA